MDNVIVRRWQKMKQPNVRSKQKNVSSRLEGTELRGSTCSAIKHHLRYATLQPFPELYYQGLSLIASPMLMCSPLQEGDEHRYQDISRDRPQQPLRHINFWSDHEAATRNPEAEVICILTHTVSYGNLSAVN